jgi:hypothetical protein
MSNPSTLFSGRPFEAWCDMSHDGGGWTLIMKQDDASDALDYNAVQWETYLLLNEEDVSANDGPYGSDAKYESFNVTQASALRLEFTDPVYNLIWNERHDMDMGEMIAGNYHESMSCGGFCSDETYTDQSTCEAMGFCSDGISTEQSTCETAGNIWTSEVWTAGLCTGTALELFQGLELKIMFGYGTGYLTNMPDYTELMTIGNHEQFYGVNGALGILRFGIGSNSSYLYGWGPLDPTPTILHYGLLIYHRLIGLTRVIME